ncbi:MAG: hypothetical protein NUW01_08825 [Gemmatimonadaceae bacterium]|nr:hypothetical protein [Gemmatimonadaceae bacterium]
MTADELNAIAVAGGLSGAELDVLDGASAGTAVASKAFVFGAFKDIDTLDFQATSGLKIAGIAVTPTAAEINKVQGVTAGTATASKAVVLGAAKDIDTIDFAATSGIKIGGTAVTAKASELNTLTGVTASMAELNKVDGILGNALAHDASAFQIVASGATAITGAGTVATGLAGGSVQQVVASFANAGTIAPTGDAAFVYAYAAGSAGSVVFECYDLAGGTATNAGTINWLAFGTAA